MRFPDIRPDLSGQSSKNIRMKHLIQSELQQLELQNNIKILYAVESGSRAWGFESIDSDWDVRFLYVHQLDWYLQIDAGRDNIERMLPNDLDFAGWELRKALRLFRKSNPPLLEWLRSPIIYLENGDAAKYLRDVSDQYFSPKSCLHHYLHMAQGNYRAYLTGDVVRVKKYFYVLRPVLACRWIMDAGTMPPMEFSQLVESQLTDRHLKTLVQDLQSRKMAGEELSEEPRISELNEYLEKEILFFVDYLKDVKVPESPDTQGLNSLFKQILISAWE